MLPKHVLELEGGIKAPERLLGTGAFKVKDTERYSFVASEADPDYFHMAPDGDLFQLLDLVTTIQFNDWDTEVAALETGQIDLAAPVNLAKGWGVKQSFGNKVDLESAFRPRPPVNPVNKEFLSNGRPPKYRFYDERPATIRYIEMLRCRPHAGSESQRSSRQ